MRRAIITGATGVIGNALVRYLIEQDMQVTVLARKDSQRLSYLPNDKNVTIVECDLSEIAMLSRHALGEHSVFYHLGWQGTYGKSRDDYQLQLNNIKYTLDAVDLANRIGCKVFIGVGSQAEYGNIEEKLSQRTPTNPKTGYGVAKLCAGQMSKLKCREYGMKHNWVRVLSVYGPFDGENTLVMYSIRRLLSNQDVLCTQCKQIWDYLYCKDAARAIYLIAEKGIDGKIYSLGSGEAHELKMYLESMYRQCDSHAMIRFGAVPYSENQVMYLCADISELTQDTGFVPKYSFDEGILETIKWLGEEKIDERKITGVSECV